MFTDCNHLNLYQLRHQRVYLRKKKSVFQDREFHSYTDPLPKSSPFIPIIKLQSLLMSKAIQVGSSPQLE